MHKGVMDSKDKKRSKQTTTPLPPNQEVSLSDSVPATHPQYEMIGALDVSVYTNCDYRPDPKTKSMSLTRDAVKSADWKKRLLNHKVVAVLLACAVVLAIVMMVNFALGVTGVSRSCCGVQCYVQEETRSAPLTDGVMTEDMEMDSQVCIT